MATFEGLKYITPITINSRERYFRSETLSLKTQTVGNGAQRWDLSITLEPATGIGGGAAGARLGVHRATHGFTSPFQVEMPQYLGTAATGNIRTDGNPAATIPADRENQSGDSIVIVDTGATISDGRFISFGSNGSKIYQVTATTATSISVFPPLVEDLPDNTVVNLSPNITVYYAQDGVEGVTYSDGVLTRATLNVVEGLN